MRVFFDTEFTGLHQNTTLISIGLIAEDGCSFYAEFVDYDENQIDKWIRENVIANLRFDPSEKDTGFTLPIDSFAFEMKGDKALVAEYLAKWLLRFDTPIKMWSDCLAYDWVLFCDLWGNAFNVPHKVYYIPFDLSTFLEIKGVNPDINREEFAGMMTEGGPKHNALWDARVIRACYGKLMEMTK